MEILSVLIQGVAAIGSRVGFSIPIENALKIANQLVQNGKVMRGWLGVEIQNLTPELAKSLKFKIQMVF